MILVSRHSMRIRRTRRAASALRLASAAFISVLLFDAAAFAQPDDTAQHQRPYADPPMPPYRILARGFEADEADIRRLLDSTGRELWRYFPDYRIEPFVVRRGHESPIVWYQRNARREIVMLLNTEETYWSQYAYQFAHEFCHILCGYDEDYKGNQWFEEAICETASLFALRAMARAWEHDPPVSELAGVSPGIVALCERSD